MAPHSCVHLCLFLIVLVSGASPAPIENATQWNDEWHGENGALHQNVRIVGGKNTPIQEIPFQASLQQYWRHICGAAIVNEKWLVTAAHCVLMIDKGPAWSWSIRAGTSWNFPYLWTGQRYSVAEMHIHPNYSEKTVDYDLGIVRIQGEFKFGAKIRPVAIPTEGEGYIQYDELATVSGWGRQKEGAMFFAWYLQSVPVPMMPRPKCAQIYQNNTRYRVYERMLCAAGVAKGSPCQGDSGGPLVLRGQAIGLVSWGMKCNDDKFPSVFTNLLNADIRKYIQEKTGA